MASPINIFRDNWKQAKFLKDPSADYCTLATVAEDGQVSTRTLVLRAVTEDSFVIFINNTSPKWQQLNYSKQIEILVFWPSLMQQYRIRGDLEFMPKEIMEQHWSKKPYESKIIDHFYTDYKPQSSALDCRDTLQLGISQLKGNYVDKDDIPFPENAAGVRVKANYIETWHGSVTDRLHDRHLYIFQDGQWKVSVLVP